MFRSLFPTSPSTTAPSPSRLTAIRSGALGTALGAALAMAALAPQAVNAQCPMPTANDFRIDVLANNDEGDLFGGVESGNYGVVQIAVAGNGKVFIAKMCSGEIRVYRPGTSASTPTVHAGTVPTHCNNEDGLLGVVLDPNFLTNGWVYVFHASAQYSTSPANADTGKPHLLTRYTYDSTQVAGSQLTNPKEILRFHRMIDVDAFHAGGGLDMGSDGVLVIGTGDDTSPHSNQCSNNNYGPLLWGDRGCDAQKSSGNTNDLRGKLLRIKPIAFADNQTPVPGIGTTYDIPPGNLWEHIDQPAFNPNWDPEVDELSLVRKEIWSMGHRNPYHPRYDRRSGWIFTGEVGYDAGSPSATRGPEGREEWNLAYTPGNFGHPYCVGPNDPMRKYTAPNTAWSTDESYDCAAIENVSPNNTGIRNLPPARPAALWYSNNNTTDDGVRLGISSAGSASGSETSIAGPMYRYDPALASAIKFPPQYEGKVFYFDWANNSKSSFRVITVNPNGTIDEGEAATPRFPASTLAALPTGSYIDMRFGPHDGAMYLLRGSQNNYSNFGAASLYRIAYTGAIDNSCYTPFVATVGTPTSLAREVIRKAVAPVIEGGMITLPVGYRSVTLYDLGGRKVWSYTRANASLSETMRLPQGLAAGVLQARLAP